MEHLGLSLTVKTLQVPDGLPEQLGPPALDRQVLAFLFQSFTALAFLFQSFVALSIVQLGVCPPVLSKHVLCVPFFRERGSEVNKRGRPSKWPAECLPSKNLQILSVRFPYNSWEKI